MRTTFTEPSGNVLSPVYPSQDYDYAYIEYFLNPLGAADITLDILSVLGRLKNVSIGFCIIEGKEFHIQRYVFFW